MELVPQFVLFLRGQKQVRQLRAKNVNLIVRQDTDARNKTVFVIVSDLLIGEPKTADRFIRPREEIRDWLCVVR